MLGRVFLRRNFFQSQNLIRHRSLPSSVICCNGISTTTICHQKKKTTRNNNNKNNDDKKQQLISILENKDLLEQIPLEDVRNFCFIAHVDHGKSSLTSRVLELTGNLGSEAQLRALRAVETGGENVSEDGFENVDNASKEKIELLDTLAVEQERGITVKASAATMLYPHPSAVGPAGVLLLNVVDTPGHVDFGREVSRSLSFVQGAVLLLDAAQGIQAQTWSVYEKTKSLQKHQNLSLLVALTKVDLDVANPIHVALTVSEWLNWEDPDTIVLTSARNRMGIADVLDAVCNQVPPPQALSDDDGNGSILRAQVVDSWYDTMRGVQCLVQILSGTLSEGDRISITKGTSSTSSESFSVQEVGLLLPKPYRTGELRRGQMGYVRFGLRDPRQAQPGTILILNNHVGKSMEMPVYVQESESKSVMYASVHPLEADGFEELSAAVERLALNDTGLEVSKTSSLGNTESSNGGPFLGPGLRVGFQGLLHVEVFRQRLSDEFGLDAVVTPPKVPYTITLLPGKNSSLTEPETSVIEDLSEWPKAGTRFKVQEPVVDIRIMAPVDYAGNVMDLISRKRGTDLVSKPMDEDTWLFTARMPWAEVVTSFHDDLKNTTSGFGSLDTSPVKDGLQEADLSKVDIMLNGDIVQPLAFVSHKTVAQGQARQVCAKLKEVLPRQQFVTIIQAKADGKIIASERIQAYRKDVLTTGGSKAVGGGDITRKKKLLEKQKRGKKRQQASGTVTLSQAAFNSVISRGNS